MKHIEYTIEDYNLGVKIHITAQSHRNEFFGNLMDGTMFKCSNGWKLESCGCPDYEGANRFYMRGNVRNKDNHTINIPVSLVEIFEQCIIEYNEYFK